LLRLRRHTESRWMSVGLAARGLLGGLAVGLSDMVQRLRADPAVSDHYLRHWERLKPRTVEFAIHASLVAFVSDGLLLEVQEDDRLLARRDEVMDSVWGEIVWLSELGPLVWRRYAALVGGRCEPMLLRGSVLRCAHIAACYMYMKTFKPMFEHPWSVAVGDVQTNLEGLLAAAPETVVEPTARMLRFLLQQEFNMTQLKDALGLVLNVPRGRGASPREHCAGAPHAPSAWDAHFVHPRAPSPNPRLAFSVAGGAGASAVGRSARRAEQAPPRAHLAEARAGGPSLRAGQGRGLLIECSSAVCVDGPGYAHAAGHDPCAACDIGPASASNEP